MNGVLVLTVAMAMLLHAAFAQNTPSKKVEFGANGHPLSVGTYSEVSLEQQISLLKSLGPRTYRVNVNPSYPDKFDRLSELISLAPHENIRILLVIVLPAKQYSEESTAYGDSEAKVFRQAKQFDTRVMAWELGSEYDLYCVKHGADGASPADYDAER